MRHLCNSILAGQREMAQMIIDGLRPQLGRSVGANLQDTGNDGDIEECHPGVRSRGGNGPNRRNRSENELSVSFASLTCRLSLLTLRRTSERSVRICANSLPRTNG